MVKSTTIRLILTLATYSKWFLYQLDVNNASLQGKLEDEVYMEQPPSFVNSKYLTYVCKHHKAIYVLRQVPSACYNEFKKFICSSGFVGSKSDTSLFTMHGLTYVVFLLLYVYDIILTGSSDANVLEVNTALAARFSLKDLQPLNYFVLRFVIHLLVFSSRKESILLIFFIDSICLMAKE